MEHHFRVDIARRYGVEEAIVIHGLTWWIAKNRAHESDREDKPHYRDGHWWSVNTYAGLRRWWPYWSEDQIRRTMARLVSREVLLQGHYGGSWRDSWWAFRDEARFLPEEISFDEFESYAQLAESPDERGGIRK